MEAGASVVVDALDFLDPQPVQFYTGGLVVEVEPLGLFDWFRFERSEERAIKQLMILEFAQGLDSLVEAIEVSSAFQFDQVTLEDALEAFVLLSEANDCQYMDPYFVEAIKSVSKKGARPQIDYYENDLDGRSIFDMVMVLARRFSMDEIREMRPEMAFLAYQYILDEQAEDRTVRFYNSELGYEKKKIGKGKSMKVKMKPIPTPYETPWIELRRSAAKHRFIKEVQSRPPLQSKLIKYPDRVVGLSKHW